MAPPFHVSQGGCLRAQSAAADSDRFCISIPSAAAEAHSHSQGPGWRRGFWRLATDGPYLPLEPVQVVADGHGKGEQFFERLLWLLKGDGDAAWLDRHPRGEILELLGEDLKRSLDQKSGPFPAILLPLGQNIRKVATAPAFIVSLIAFPQASQVGDEGLAIGEAARADPFGNTGSHDLLRPPSAHAEQKFEGGAIDKRAGEGLQLADDIVDFAVPERFGGQGWFFMLLRVRAKCMGLARFRKTDKDHCLPNR